MPMPKTSPRAAGFLAIEDTKDEKIFPIPIPTPANAITARPAPINFAASASIILFLLFLLVINKFDCAILSADEWHRLNTNTLVP